ncbi:Tyrosine--tRNA ligase [Drechslerella dactyloides]|uniref:tyrosine--tRNA ligase n=1 Tax=Drechslerella dactyloides TaxID=74499 RepID=A0AAD6IWB3_DREDA|nr:Tyrosine--tRNA ligase [Drechslerella dactyloides]
MRITKLPPMKTKGTPLLTVSQRYELITRRQELFYPWTTEETLKELLEENPHPTIGWVTAPTGKPHIGYLMPLAKMVDFLRAGLKPIILYVDVYALLVNYVHPLPLITERLVYYRYLTIAVLSSLGVEEDEVKHIAESSYAYTEAFVREFHKLIVLMKQTDAHCTSEVAETDMLSPLLFLDANMLRLTSQEDLFYHSATFLPKIGHKPREHMMHIMAPSLKSSPDRDKMSSSHASDTKIEFLDDRITVNRKIQAADCPAGDISDANCVLSLLRDVIWPISLMRVERLRGDVGYHKDEGCELQPSEQRPLTALNGPAGTIFSIWSNELRNWIYYEDWNDLEGDYKCGAITPEDLKESVGNWLNLLLLPIREAFRESEEWQMAEKKAYPGGVY